MVTLEPPDPQKVVSLRVSVCAGQNGCMIDPKNPSECPWVWAWFLGVVNENVSFVKGDMNDILILLDVIGDKIYSYN